MARIIISHQTPVYHEGQYQAPAFYEGLIESLRENGNDVLHLVSNDYLFYAWNGTNKPYKAAIKDDLHQKIKDFRPDLIIAFNNSIIEGVEDIVSCPIILWDADSIAFFNDKDTIKKNSDRYLYLAVSDHGINEYINQFSAPQNRILKMRFATAIKAKPLEQDYNISFIGTNFKIHRSIQSFFISSPEKARELVHFSNTHTLDELKTYLSESGLDSLGIAPEHVRNIVAGQMRMQTLSAVAPLGIELFGDINWYKIYDFSLPSFMGFNPHLVYTLDQNETIYNRSKISISISHSQNVTAYPWRVTDIMASNAVLVSDKKMDIVRDFGDKVNLQLYETPYEAYALCQRLLNEPNLRKDITLASQEIIDESYRWHHRLADIGSFSGVNLLEKKSSSGSYQRYAPPSDLFDHLLVSSLQVADGLIGRYRGYQINISKSTSFSSLGRKMIKRVPHRIKIHFFNFLRSRHKRAIYTGAK